MKHVTVFRDESIYASHASVCQAKNGDILVTFRQAPLEPVFAHVHPKATAGLMRSTDMGETWDPATRITVLDPGDEMNLNDPALTTLSDGTLIITAFILPAPYASSKDKWGDSAKPVRGTDYLYVPHEQKIILRRSFDNGHTWDGPYTIETNYYKSGFVSTFASVVELSDGSIILPVNEKSPEEGKHVASIIRSTDQGKTWEPYSLITKLDDSLGATMGFGLPSIAAYDDNHLLAAGWTIAESGTLVTSSEDGGKNWSQFEPIDTKGSCMHLCIAKSGTVVMSYGYRHVPYGIHVLPSYDKGKTWDTANAAALRSDGAMRDVGYPWTIQMSDGRFFCAYYFNVHDEDKSGYYNEEESLKICKQWNLDPPLYTYQTAGLRFIGGTIFTEEEMRGLAGTATIEPEQQKDGPTLL